MNKDEGPLIRGVAVTERFIHYSFITFFFFSDCRVAHSAGISEPHIIGKQNKTKQKTKWKTQLLLNIVYDIAFKSRKRFQHSDVISQVIPGMRSKVSKWSQSIGGSLNMRYFQLVIASQIIIWYILLLNVSPKVRQGVPWLQCFG